MIKVYYENNRLNLILFGDWSLVSTLKDKIKSFNFHWDENKKVWYKELSINIENKKIIIQQNYQYFTINLKQYINDEDWINIAKEIKNENEPKVVKIESDLPLMNHQKIAHQKYLDQDNHLLLAMSMGTGKSLTSLSITKSNNKKAIVIVPKSLIYQWKEEILKWNITTEDKIFIVTENKEFNMQYLGKREYDFIILNYEKLRFMCESERSKEGKINWTDYEKELFNFFNKLNKQNYVLIYDEGYKVKNYKSDLFKAHKKFKNMGWNGIMILTGTPMENNLYEFYTILNFTKQDTITYQEMEKNFVFRTKWGQPIYRNLALFNKMASKIMYRVTMEEVKADMPKLIQEYRFVEHNDEALKLKQKLLEEALSVFEIYTTLRVIDSYLNPTDEDSKYFKFMEVIEHNKKYNELIDVLEEIGDKQILIFTAYEKTAKWLKEKLQKDKYKVDYISSAVKDKEGIKQEFIKGDLQIVIATETWARGVDLPTIDNLVNWDFPLNPSTYAQRITRIYRVNSENPKLVVNLISNIIEQDVYDLVRGKIEKIEQAVEGLGEKDILNALFKKWGMSLSNKKKEE